MKVLYEYHYEHLICPLPPIEADQMAELNVLIYDSVRKDYAITICWQDNCIRKEWGVVKGIDRADRKIKLVRDDGSWWVPIDKLLQVVRV
ncbi:YolD-like family protein [uncultured Brevibacillus sp.]|uniref:YolD-like family protein n=1 Tax=uncultured Brevibacillus sp. TaxID=169970 RepID=UPI00259708E8|nr:YolD-like family protein [uncultured Brevibacillus sp.]